MAEAVCNPVRHVLKVQRPIMEKSDLRNQSVRRFSRAALVDQRESLHESANPEAHVTTDNIFQATLFES